MIDAFLKVAERFGVPTAILVLVAVAVIAFIRGPLTKFTEMVGAPLVQLVKVAIDFVSRASAALGALPGQIALEGERTRAHVTEQIAGAVTELRDRVSDAERGIAERAVTGTGQHPAVRSSTLPTEPVWAPAAAADVSAPAPPAGASASAPATPAVTGGAPSAAGPATVPDKPRAPLPTLPSIQPPPASSAAA